MLAPPEKRLGRANENRKEQIVFSTFPIKQKSGFAISKPDLKRDGTPSLARTVDKLIKSQLLYQLS